MGIILKVLGLIARIILYPITYTLDMISIALNKRKPKAIKLLIVTYKSLLLVAYFTVCFAIASLPSIQELLIIMPAVPVFIEEDAIEFNPNDYESMSGKLANSSGASPLNINYAGNSVSVDMSRVDEKTVVNLPKGMYANGSALQRIQLLYIVEEICARPEITCTPQELLGYYYSECTAYIPTTSANLLTTTWKVEYNAYNCGGPFQHQRGAWEGKDLYRGKAFISKLENASLSDEQRVLTSDNCNLTVNGLKRPSMFYFPDAAYSAAYRISKHKSTTEKLFHFTGDMVEWGKTQGMSQAELETLKVVSACGYYNGYTSSVKSYIPPLYIDILRANGSIDKWSNLASSRASLNTQLKSLASSTKRTLPNFQNVLSYYDNYSTALNNGNWQSTQFAFMVYNGGKYVYDGLKALSSQLPQTNTGVTVDSANYSDKLQKVIAWAEQWVGQSSFRHKDSSMCVSKNWCARFLWNAYNAGVGEYFGGDAEDAPHDHPMPSDYSTIPAGASIVSKGSGGYAGHVGLCIGNGYLIEAGGPIVQKVKISESYGRGKFLGWGMLYDFGTETSNPSDSFSKLYSVIKTCYGKPYVFGGVGPDTFDCSGFVYYCFKKSGLKNWTRTSANGLWTTQVTRISKSELQPGDLIFYTPWGSPNSTRAGHVAIYIGNNKGAHAPQEGDVVKEFDSNYEHPSQKILGYGRVK